MHEPAQTPGPQVRSDIQPDIQSDIQKDIPSDIQCDIQKDIHVDLQRCSGAKKSGHTVRYQGDAKMSRDLASTAQCGQISV